MNWKKLVSRVAATLIVFFIFTFIFENYVSIDQTAIFEDMYDYANDSMKEMITADFANNCAIIKDASPEMIKLGGVSNPEALIDLCQKFNSNQIDRKGLYLGIIDLRISEMGINDPLAQFVEMVPAFAGIIGFFSFLGKYALLFIVLLAALIVIFNLKNTTTIGIIASKILINISFIFVIPFIVIYFYILVFQIDTSQIFYALTNNMSPISDAKQMIDLFVLVLARIYTFTVFIIGIAGLVLGFLLKFLMKKIQDKMNYSEVKQRK